MAEKKFLADIKLVGSVVKDESGNQISLTKDERLGVVNASGGPTSETNPLVTLDKHDQDLEALKAGIRWRPPVNTATETAPLTPVIGDRYLNLTDNMIYECEVDGDWGSGTAPEANWTVFAKDTDEQWTYDADDGKWIMSSSGAIPYATTEVPGKVELADDGEVASGKAVQGNDSRLIKGHYSTTLENPTGTVEVTHNLGSQKVIVQAWASGETVDIQVARKDTDPTNVVEISLNGTPTSVDIYIIALP